MEVRRDRSGVIINSVALTDNEVVKERVLCPGCREKVFEEWPFGWDSHSAFKCKGVSGTPEERKTEFKQRFAQLFRQR